MFFFKAASREFLMRKGVQNRKLPVLFVFGRARVVVFLIMACV